MNPNDDDIIRDIGDCLIQTHNYHKVIISEKALRYYEDSLQQNPKRMDLMLDLGKLYTQICSYDKAEKLLQPQFFSEDF